MNKEEYYNRLNKITSKISSDRVSKDEEYNLICQKNYLATKYIESLEQENNQLKEQRQELRSWLEDEISKGGSSIDLAIRIHTIQEVLNRLEGKNE